MPASLARPVLRDSVLVYRDGEHLLRFVLTSSATVKEFLVDETTMRLVPLLDGSRTVEDLERAVSDTPGYLPEQLTDSLAVLHSEALLRELPLHDDRSDFSPAQLHRYDRQLHLFADLVEERQTGGFDSALDMQRRLRDATVVVIGAGGTGTWVLTALAAAGVGTLRVCDHDRVETSHLTRQALYATADVGRPKLEVAAERLAALNPDVTVDPLDLRVSADTRSRSRRGRRRGRGQLRRRPRRRHHLAVGVRCVQTTGGAAHRRRIVRLPPRCPRRHRPCPGAPRAGTA